MSEKLLMELMIWATMLSGYPMPDELPAVEQVTHEFFIAHYCGGNQSCPVYGWYPGVEGALKNNIIKPATIYIEKDLFAADEIGAQSIVVHEMVHYLQDRGGVFGRYDCGTWEQNERQAYHVQTKFLRKHYRFANLNQSKSLECNHE